MLVRAAQFVLFVLAFLALAWLWGTYDTFDSLTYFIRAEFGARPIYADPMPVYLSDSSTFNRFLVAVGIAATFVSVLIVASLRRWRAWICVILGVVGAIAINASVASIRGEFALYRPYTRVTLEYYGDVERVNDAPLKFISNYASISPTLSHHAGTHPPGGVLFLWLGSKLFGPSIEAATWWSVAFGALGVIPAYWLARQLLGSARARRIIPLYLLTPSLVIFGATSMDIVFLVFATAALAAMFWAMKRLSVTRILVAGGLYWLAAFMSFAVITLPIVAGLFAALMAIRRPRRAAKMLLRLALVGLAFIFFEALAELLVGYDLQLVAQSAMHVDFRGMRYKGYESFALWKGVSITNLAAFAMGTGLALSAWVLASALTLPFARPWMLGVLPRLAVAIPVCLVLISCSTLFSLETERVWLAVVPAMLCVAAGVRSSLVWILLIALLGAQTFLTELALDTKW